jgi:hypothetical protein
MQSVGGTCLLSRSVTATVVSKTYRRTRDNRALSIGVVRDEEAVGSNPRHPDHVMRRLREMTV